MQLEMTSDDTKVVIAIVMQHKEDVLFVASLLQPSNRLKAAMETVRLGVENGASEALDEYKSVNEMFSKLFKQLTSATREDYSFLPSVNVHGRFTADEQQAALTGLNTAGNSAPLEQFLVDASRDGFHRLKQALRDAPLAPRQEDPLQAAFREAVDPKSNLTQGERKAKLMELSAALDKETHPLKKALGKLIERTADKLVEGIGHA